MDDKSHIIPIKDIKNITEIKKINTRVACEPIKEAIHRGFIRCSCTINTKIEAFGIELDEEIENGTDGTFNDIDVIKSKNYCAILVNSRIEYLELDERTDFVIKHSVGDIVKESGKIGINEHVSVDTKGKIRNGVVKNSGRINGIFCYAVDLISSDETSPCIVTEYCVRKIIDQKESLCSNAVSSTYVHPRYTMSNGDFGIQGNLNSCYLDTSIFAIFTFNMFLDNMLLDKTSNKNIQELQDILRDDIVYPLRRKGYVGLGSISEFRDKLHSLSPNGKFLMNERDPEELLEKLFELLTPQKYLLRTKCLGDFNNGQNCFLTQIFYQTSPEKRNINLLEMLTLSFLEFEMLISMPPKCLILQLPRDGKLVKNFKRAMIPEKLDITPFIVASPKKCKECSVTGMEHLFCKVCSLARLEMTYFCPVHRCNCTHQKIKMPSVEHPYNGSVVLELVSVLCIQKNHYVTFVKTNEVLGKWIYFNSMENIDGGIFTPAVRDTNLHQYFSKPFDSRKSFENDLDVERVENFAFVLVYKYPAMEFYGTDFNSN